MAQRLIACLLLALTVPVSRAADAADPAKLAGDNIGRTESDDETRQGDAPTQLGTLGPTLIPVRMERDGQATVGLYTPGGRLTRILGQILNLKKGVYNARWDGLDLFGHIVPEGTDLDVKIITNDPIKAFYEFSVSAPKVAPWGGRFGDGANRRAGGWLGDHSAPRAIAAVGDRILIGATVAEHGDNLIAVNSLGEKLWGTKFQGWNGPRLFTTDGRFCYALDRHGRAVFRVDPEERAVRDGYAAVKEQILTSSDPIQAMAAGNGQLYLVCEDGAARVSPFSAALAHQDIDFGKCTPLVLETKAATEFLISPQTAFANTFTSGGSPQNGARCVPVHGDAFVLAAFKRPVEIGTFVIGSVPGVKRVEVYALKPGLVYDERLHSPARGRGGAESLIEDEINTLVDKFWIPLGQAEAVASMAVVPTPDKTIPTTAVYFKCVRPDGAGANRDWRPAIGMARLMARRFERVRVGPGARTVSAMPVSDPTGAAGAGAWRFRSKTPVSEIYPAQVILDLGQSVSVDGIALLNCVNPRVDVDAFAGGAGQDVTAAPENAWQPVAEFRGAYDKRLRHLTASRHANEQYLAFVERVSTRALRFRVTTGYRSGKWGAGDDDPFRVEVDDIALLRLLNPREKAPSHVLKVAALPDGRILHEWRSGAYNLPALACDSSGSLYTVADRKLCRSALDARSGELRHTALNASVLIERPLSMAVAGDCIAVGEQARAAVFVFGLDGRLRTVIGDRGPRRRGAWDPNVLERPSGVAIAADGSVWVAEELFAPKRVAKFAPDGRFLDEFLGPPMYGGGGYLDPDRKAFYYRSMEFGLDWEKGASRLKNLNDRLRSEETPVQELNSFNYTPIGEPVCHGGRRYVVRGGTICLLDGAVWKPCVVMGGANENYFLLGKECWKKHWAAMDLTNRSLIWCDQNDDGLYQPDEVELVEGEQRNLFGGLAVGPGLVLWGGMRVEPHRFTPGGVPVYRWRDFRSFDYGRLAPHYSRNYTLSGPRSAKPHYFGFKRVLSDGSLIQEGQPFVVKPDMTILGGPPPKSASDYVPPIDGVVLQTPWSFTGGAVTKSDLGEVAIVNSNNGYWYVWAARYGVLVGTFFTGETGGWGWGMPVERGLDVSGRKQEWEAWGGHFVRAQDGRDYAVAGKGFHGISRIEGLDNYRAAGFRIRVTKEQAEAAATLRPFLKRRYEAARADGEKKLDVQPLSRRTSRFKLDGDLEDWGNPVHMQTLGEDARRVFFDAAAHSNGIYLAFSGRSRLAARPRDWRRLFLSGFALDFRFRTDARSRSRETVAGDRRIVVGKCDGQWTAVLYDYEVPGAPTDDRVELTAKVTTTTIDRVVRLPSDAYRAAVREDTLGVNVDTLETVDEATRGADLPGTDASDRPQKSDGRVSWSAELFFPWATLGLSAGTTVRCDFGASEADAPATGSAGWVCWSDAAPGPVDEPALAALMNPAAWGSMTLPR
jgi:hypothetical protein